MRRAILALILAASVAGPVSAQEAGTPSAAGGASPPAGAQTEPSAAAAALKTTPTAKGLPVVVRTALHVADIASVDEQKRPSS